MSLRPSRAPRSRLDIALAAGLRVLDIGAGGGADDDADNGKRALEDGDQGDASKRLHVLTEDESKMQTFMADLMEARQKSSTRERVLAMLRAVELHVLQPATISKCNTQLRLQYNDGPCERRRTLLACANGDVKATKFQTWTCTEAQIELKTRGGCTLSVMGLTWHDTKIEVASMTPVGQRRKNYHKILRAVAMIFGYGENMDISAEVINNISAYSWLRYFSTQVTFMHDVPGGTFVDSKSFSEPLDAENANHFSKDAEFYKTNIAYFVVKSDDQNYMRAVNLLVNAAIACADAAAPRPKEAS